MSRVADALKRARTDAVAGSDDHAAEPIHFFASGQPAVVIPWDIGAEAGGRSSAGEPRPVQAEEQAPAARPERGRAARDHVVQRPTARTAEKLIVSETVTPVARDQYVKLAAALHKARLEHDIKVVMFTSATAGEGKTLTATNVALTLSELYERHVLLIDADMRRPEVHEMFQVSNAHGLSDLLAGQDRLPLIQARPRLSLLTAGPPTGDPTKTLSSDRMRALVEESRRNFDWVLLDTAPVGLMSDAKLLTSMVDVTLLVIRAGKVGYELVQRAADVLGQDRIFGVVLNGADDSALTHLHGHGYYYDDATATGN